MELPSLTLFHDSVLSQYLRSCRLATYPVVIREISVHFDKVKNTEHIGPSTKVHMAGHARGSDLSSDMPVEHHLNSISVILPDL